MSPVHTFSRACLCLLFLLATGCSTRKAEVILSQAETALETEPGTAVAWLSSSDSSLFKTRRLKADRALLFAKAFEKMGIDTNDVNIIEPAVDYYSHHKPLNKRALAWYYQGKILINDNAYPEALVSLMHARKEAERAKDVTQMSQIVQATGDVYGKCFLYEDALTQYQEAYAFADSAKNPRQLNTIRYSLARTYNNLKQFEQADSLFNILFKEEKNRMDTLTYIRVLADYALLKVNYSKDYPMAEVLYGLALSRRRSFDSYNHWGAFAYTKARNGKMGQAELLFKQLEQSGKDAGYALQVWKSRTMALQSEYKDAFSLLDLAVDNQTDRVREVLKQSAMRAQRDYFEEEFRHSQQENRLIRFIILLALILFLGAAYILYSLFKRQKEKHQLQEMNILETTRSLSEQVDELHRERTLLQEKYIKIHQNHLKEFGSLLKTTLGVTEINEGTKQTTLYEKAKETMATIVQDSQGDRIFEDQINACFDDAMRHLRTELPNHTEEYYRFAGFVFAGFDNQTLMAITGTRSLDSIYAKKKRLRQDIARSDAAHRTQLLQLVH